MVATMSQGSLEGARRTIARCAIFAIFALTLLINPHSSLAQPSSIARAAGVMTGTLADALGKPIADATVALHAADGHVVAVTHSDARGHFAFHGLALGSYQISAAQRDFQPANQTFVLDTKSRSTHLDLTLAPRAPLTLAVVAQRLDVARNALSPETGGSAYRFDQPAIHKLPQGANSAISQLLVQAPGVSLDTYGQGQGQIHIHGENGGGMQYRLNGVFLPEAVSSYGEIFSPRFVRSLTLLTGVLPAQIGFRNEGIIDVHTKDGCADGGASNNNVDLYGGQRTTFEPSFEFGGCAGRLSYYTSGFYLESALGLPSPTKHPAPKHDQT